MTLFSLAAPVTWSDAFARSATVAVVGFVVLQAKEYIDAGMFDTPATAADAVLIAAGVLIVNAVLMWVKPR